MDKKSLDIHKSLKLEAITSSPMGIAVFSAVDTDGYILEQYKSRHAELERCMCDSKLMAFID